MRIVPVEGSTMAEDWHDKGTLESLYHGEGLSQEEVAEQLGCSRETIVAWMKKLEVDAREPNETRNYGVRERLWESNREILDRYQSGEPMYAIADDFDVQDQTLRRFLEGQGVETRGMSEQLEESFSTERADSLDVNIPSELRDPRRLREMYIEEEMSTREIGRALGCSGDSVSQWLGKHGVEVRSRSKAVELSRRGPPRIHTGRRGYEYIHHSGHAVGHHRLLATLLVDDLSDLHGKHVHHGTGVEWDNRLSKLELLDFKSHMDAHREVAHE